MERQRNNEDFEKLLRDNANQYRMYPSEKVWNNIHSALHTRRRWYGLTAAIMLLVTGTIVSTIIYNGNTGKNNLREKSVAQSNVGTASVENKTQQKYTPAVKETETTPNRPRNVEELVRDNQAFNFPTINSEELHTTADQTDLAIRDEAVVVLIPVISEPLNNESFNTDPGLVKFNNEIKTENTEATKTLSPDNFINDQGRLDNETENKIDAAISALASQNISLPKPNKHARVTAQVYFTPTVSYRRLSENKKAFNNTGIYMPMIDINNMVKHKPAMGLEFGIEGKYHLNDKLSIKTGLQFNINRYDIRTYYHTQEIATVALSSGSGFDSLATTTNLRNNYGGTDASWLENFYFQTAVPVGVEYIISNKKNVQWGVSATIQPTYVIGDRAYLISSDYKNYARFPDLMRRWNISSGFETFVSYSTGKIRWQVGPHVRYQHLSSFVSTLTVKEKLFAAGIKVAATINKNK